MMYRLDIFYIDCEGNTCSTECFSSIERAKAYFRVFREENNGLWGYCVRGKIGRLDEQAKRPDKPIGITRLWDYDTENGWIEITGDKAR